MARPTTLPRLLALALAAIVLVAACSPRPAPTPRSTISTGDDRLRTFPVIHEIDGVMVTCASGPLPASPVVGVLEGDPMDPHEPVWLRSPDGRRLSIVWPEGFSVSFEPEAKLRNERGRIVARAGDRVELFRETDSATGSYDDPYFASCHLFGGVYVRG